MPLLCTQTGFSCPVGVLIWPVVHVSMDVLLLSEKGRHFLNGTLMTADDCTKVQSLFRSEGDKLRPWPYLRSDILSLCAGHLQTETRSKIEEYHVMKT